MREERGRKLGVYSREKSRQEVVLAARSSKAKREPEETIGQRLGRLRRQKGLTQLELAEELGVTQPQISQYERGELRLHGELIVTLTKLLGVSADELLGLEPTKDAGAGKNRRLARRLQEIEQLPARDQQAILRTLDAFLTK